MEISFSKKYLTWIAALIALVVAVFAVVQSGALRFLFEKETNSAAYNSQPAIQALATIYAPSGDQQTWEQAACLNMTQNGCDLFKFYYAPAIWKSGVQGTNAQFIEIVDSLEDGTQVWLTGITLRHASRQDSVQPVFIHVQKREDDKWVLERILFEEEAQKYAQ
jgi:hypothetical protein